ncbi:MAG TPA: hypothetical protein VH650_05095 [Gaiellaceae bacterium]|jgi:hypothetical protein
MTLGRKTLLATALLVAVLVPASATAGNGNGHGNGNGPPAWAGAGGGGAKVNGKPAWAGQGHGQATKAEKAAARAERKAARADDPETDEVGPKHENPAWVCKFERESLGAEGFAAQYGDAPNAFGKCVSREAHERDGVTAPDEGQGEDPGEAEGESGGGALISEDDPALVEVLAALQSLLEALTQIL